MSHLNRVRMSDNCRTVRHKFSIDGHEGYLHVGLLGSGQPGEVFIRMAKEGSTLSGLMDTLAVQISLCLQYGVPLEEITDHFSHTRYEPYGKTNNPEIPDTSSLTDYIGRYLALNFSGKEAGAT